jgi:pimeloyl-ACP methyl ester carboxylesterase
MAELRFVYDLSDTDKKIYGLLQAVEDPSAPVVVFVHGLGSHMNEKAIRFSAFAAVEAGYTALRLNLYGTEPDARDTIDCTIDTHVSDVSEVLTQIRSSGRRIAVVGHSLGAIVMQRLDRSLFDVAVIWDPVDVQTEDFSKWSDVTHDVVTGNWNLDWTSNLAVSQAFFDSWWGGEPDHHNMGVPTLIVCAGDSDLQQECERYQKAQSAESSIVTIDGADHYFASREATERLYAETMNWLKRHF